jgi:transcriptional regulator with XRE-family HTH domain
MPARNPETTELALQQLQRLGEAIRTRRKALGLNATLAAEAANMSRVTWHRVEKGEPSVTAGAYANALQVLGLALTEGEPAATLATASANLIPALITLDRYPQLKQLAWHIKGNEPLTAREAFDLYERNQRHLSTQAMSSDEQALFDALQLGFGGSRSG